MTNASLATQLHFPNTPSAVDRVRWGSDGNELQGHYPSDLLVLRRQAVSFCHPGYRRSRRALHKLPACLERCDNDTWSIFCGFCWRWSVSFDSGCL